MAVFSSAQLILRYPFLLAILLLTGPAPGEGIPVAPDRKSVTVDSYTVSLNDDQRKEVERSRKLTLTEAQMAQLWALHDRAPQTIDVVSSQYDSCDCGMGMYGIWCRPGEIEIPWSSVNAEREKDSGSTENPDPAEQLPEKPDPGNHESTRVILDSAGKIYLDGKERQEADILALIDTLSDRQKQNDWLTFWITLDVPPPINDVTDTRIRELAGRVEAKCKERSVGFWALGLSADKFR